LLQNHKYKSIYVTKSKFSWKHYTQMSYDDVVYSIMVYCRPGDDYKIMKC